jgi:RimJ/RimL family protein N-acetyltransferase
MALSFFDASPYSNLGVDEDRVEVLISTFLEAPKEDKIVLLWETDRPVGMLAATAEVNLFNNRRFAGELIWWIDPEHRKTKAAEEMRKAFEFWAAKVGCQSVCLVDVMGNLDVYYKRKGYDRRETAYLKVL